MIQRLEYLEKTTWAVVRIDKHREYLGHVLQTIMSMLRDIWSPIALTDYDNYGEKPSPCHCMGLWQRLGETEVDSFLQRYTNTLKMIPTTLS